MKEFTSTVTLTFDINNIEAKSQKQYIKALKEQYFDLYNVYLKDHEIFKHTGDLNVIFNFNSTVRPTTIPNINYRIFRYFLYVSITLLRKSCLF